MIVVTDYQRLLTYIVPDFVARAGGWAHRAFGRPELALELEETGYGGMEDERAGDECSPAYRRPEKGST